MEKSWNREVIVDVRYTVDENCFNIIVHVIGMNWLRDFVYMVTGLDNGMHFTRTTIFNIIYSN